MTDNDISNDVPELSLIAGGPLYRIIKSTGLGKTRSRFLYPFALVAAVTWLPLLLLSYLEGHASGGAGIPFLNDITVHVRFLVALPALYVAEVTNHEIIGTRIKNFVTRRIVRGDELIKFKAAVDTVHRTRDSTVLEAAIVALVYTFGLWVWRSQVAVAGPTWYASPDGTRMHLTIAGYWLVFVSVPILQFLLLRWYVRMVSWSVFLYRVSRLKLKLVPTHSDRAAGIGFLGQCPFGFGGVLFAEGALLSAFIANGVRYGGVDLLAYKFDAFAFIVVFVGMVVVQLAVFTPPMLSAKWAGLKVYGSLASTYMEGFDRKWIGGLNPEGEELLGTSDIQSLADLSNSYDVLKEMLSIPIYLNQLVWLAAITAVPLLPLLFFEFSIQQLCERLLQVLI